MPTPASAGHVDVDGVKLYYAIYGKGSPVILLHGGMGNGDHWALQLPALVDSFQVIAIDSRGQGRSTRNMTAASYELMANDVIAIMDHLKIEHAAIVGWSDGGEIGLDLAIHHGSRVDRLFIMGASYDATGSKPKTKPAPTFNAYAAKCRADYEKMSATPKQWSELMDWLLPLWRKPIGFTKEQLRSINVPTLVADGDHDEIVVLAHIKQMAKLIPNAHLAVFKNTSHFAMWQDPASFNKALVDFLTAH